MGIYPGPERDPLLLLGTDATSGATVNRDKGAPDKYSKTNRLERPDLRTLKCRSKQQEKV